MCGKVAVTAPTLRVQRPEPGGGDVTEYWYNVKTHEIEEDAMSDWTQLIGPYKTRQEAEHALEKVKARNDAWDAQDDD
jgi:hypothetical protein